MVAVPVRGAVAVKGEGGASEGAGCSWSELTPPMATAPGPDKDDPSPPEKTPVKSQFKTRVSD